MVRIARGWMAVALLCSKALAGDAATESRLQELSAKIDALQGEIDALKAQQSANANGDNVFWLWRSRVCAPNGASR
jgi:outer membrane murein-binding lipoprotein Lpp